MGALPRACLAAMLLPLVLAAVTLVTVSAGERLGRAPFAGLMARNSAEAAGMGNAAQLLWFLRRAEDPRAIYDVRPEIISSAVRRATTLEAAMWSRQREMFQLLDQAHAISDEARRDLACLASDLGVDDVLEYLAPDGAICIEGEALERVMARTSGEDGR